MKRRQFLQGLIAIPTLAAIPVLAKTDSPANMGGFTLESGWMPSDLQGMHMWTSAESRMISDQSGAYLLEDISGNGNHLTMNGFTLEKKPSNRDIIIFNEDHDEKTRAKIRKYLSRPDAIWNKDVINKTVLGRYK